MARGDILFYTASPTSVLDHLIAWRTHGPFVHVEVDLGDGYSIGALHQGVMRHPVDYGHAVHYTIETASPKQIEAGITWLESQEGAAYSFVALLNFILPRKLRFPFVASERDAYMCSGLVTRYLDILGVDLVGLDPNPDQVSPNDLARFFGVRAQ